MKDSWKKYAGWGVTVLAVCVSAIIILFCFLKFNVIMAGIRQLFSALASVIIGLIIAYVLAPVYDWMLKNLHWLLCEKAGWKSKNAHKTVCTLAMIATFVLALGLVSGLIAMIIPRLIESVTNVVNALPNSTEEISARIEQFLSRFLDMNSGPVLQVYERAMTYAQNWITQSLLPYLTEMVSKVSGGVFSVVKFAKNMLIGLVVAVYMLAGKNRYGKSATRLLYSVTGARVGNIIMDNVWYIHRMFSGFIGGKIIDSFIIGIICGFVLAIMNIPYAMLISVIIGVTNVIPFFGPFIGAVPCALLLLMVQPFAALKFLIFILILQQFDGNILGPKILGNSTGLSSFGVLFSILLFGGLFGFVGMIIGVPVFAVLLHILESLISIGLRRHALPENADAYARLDHIDETTKQPVRRTIPEDLCWKESELHTDDTATEDHPAGGDGA